MQEIQAVDANVHIIYINKEDLAFSHITNAETLNEFVRGEKKSDQKNYVFIDEIQDYKQEWLDLIINYFSHKDTEIVVFGDEKQNIYDRELDENKEIKTTGISGQWNRSLKNLLGLNMILVI